MADRFDRPFRFGVVAGHAPDAKTWLDTARQIEERGFDTLLLPDTLGTPSPFPALAAAASVTTTLRFCPHVLAVPLRTPGQVARDTATLDLMSDGRFELGLGVGRPGVDQEAERLGMPYGSAGERLRQLAATLEAVRAEFAGLRPQGGSATPLRPPARERAMPRVLLAGTGRKLMTLAAAEADALTFALPPNATEDDLASKVGEFQALAGPRLDEVELATNLGVVGDDPPPWIERVVGAPVEQLRAAEAYSVLSGTPDRMADTLRRRRERLGISYVTVPTYAMDAFTPVLQRLAGT